MSVNAGWGGQSFIPSSLRAADGAARAVPPGAGVEIDGGVGPDDHRRLRARPGERLAAGSAIFSAPDPAAAYHDLVERVRAAGRPTWS